MNAPQYYIASLPLILCKPDHKPRGEKKTRINKQKLPSVFIFYLRLSDFEEYSCHTVSFSSLFRYSQRHSINGFLSYCY